MDGILHWRVLTPRVRGAVIVHGGEGSPLLLLNERISAILQVLPSKGACSLRGLVFAAYARSQMMLRQLVGRPVAVAGQKLLTGEVSGNVLFRLSLLWLLHQRRCGRLWPVPSGGFLRTPPLVRAAMIRV